MALSQHPIFIIVTIAILSSSSPHWITPTLSQQPYIREYGTDCDDQPKNTSALGYLCDDALAGASCHAFLSFRARKPYDTVAAVAAHLSADPDAVARANSVAAADSRFEANALVFVPVECTCRGGRELYEYDTSYVADADDDYFEIANVTFQGLTTCQAIANQTGNPPILNLQAGDRVKIPLRCACPSKNQTDIGIKYLLSYITDEDDDDSKISDEFGVDNALFLKANRLSDLDNTIYPDTTVLVPLRSWPPNASQTLDPPPFPPPPPETTILSLPPRSSSKTRVYALAGGLGGSLALLVLSIAFVVFFLGFRKRKLKEDDSVSVSKSRATRENPSEDVLKQVITSDVAESLKVYNVEELKLATDNFGPTCLIEGSVYRGTINGVSVAIKKIDADVSKEINLLQKINHYNIVRLEGICFDEGRWYGVYEYVSKGSLSDWLFKNNKNYDDNNNDKFLTWIQRIQIALDVAMGLNYLHSFANPSHVHKDIKSSSILLDSDFKAKIANFGLARSTRAQEGEFSVTTRIVGTIGYLAPEYLETGLVSTKLDVYAFGVVLLEMITGKEVSELYEENRNLTNLFSGLISDDEGQAKKGLKDFLDVSLGEKYPDWLVVFVVRIIDACLKRNPEVRPTMDEIVQFFSKALSHSIAWEMSNLVGISKYFDGKN